MTTVVILLAPLALFGAAVIVVVYALYRRGAREAADFRRIESERADRPMK